MSGALKGKEEQKGEVKNEVRGGMLLCGEKGMHEHPFK